MDKNTALEIGMDRAINSPKNSYFHLFIYL